MAEITALGATLLHSLWQATLLALLLWSISRYGTLGAAARYRMAYGMLLLQVTLSVVTFLRYYTPAPRLESSVKQVVIAFVGFHPAEGQTYDRFTDPDFWMTALVGCWLLTMVVGSVRLGASFRRVRRMLWMQSVRRLQAPDAYAALELRVTQLASRLGYRGRLRIRIGRGITTPMLIGHFKPVLLFPLALVNQLSTEEAETVILHELAHLRRYDHYFNLLQCLIEVLYYYHPAVHWIGARMREEREYCCDDLVLHYGPGKLPYARALLHYGEQAGGQPATALSLTDGGGLLARVRRFIDHQELTYTMNNRLFLLPIIALFCLVATAVYTPFAEAEEPTEKVEKPVEIILPAFVDTLPDGSYTLKRISTEQSIEATVAHRKIQQLLIDDQAIAEDELQDREPMVEALMDHFSDPVTGANDTIIVFDPTSPATLPDTLVRHVRQLSTDDLRSAKSYLKGFRDGAVEGLQQLGVPDSQLERLRAAPFRDVDIDGLELLEEVNELQHKLDRIATDLRS